VVWLSVLFIYKGLVLLADLLLAFETRKVKIKSLNESRFVAVSVFGAVLALKVLIPVVLFLQDFPTVQYLIIGMVILFITTLILGLVFALKVLFACDKNTHFTVSYPLDVQGVP